MPRALICFAVILLRPSVAANTLEKQVTVTWEEQDPTITDVDGTCKNETGEASNALVSYRDDQSSFIQSRTIVQRLQITDSPEPMDEYPSEDECKESCKKEFNDHPKKEGCKKACKYIGSSFPGRDSMCLHDKTGGKCKDWPDLPSTYLCYDKKEKRNKCQTGYDFAVGKANTKKESCTAGAVSKVQGICSDGNAKKATISALVAPMQVAMLPFLWAMGIATFFKPWPHPEFTVGVGASFGTGVSVEVTSNCGVYYCYTAGLDAGIGAFVTAAWYNGLNAEYCGFFGGVSGAKASVSMMVSFDKDKDESGRGKNRVIGGLGFGVGVGPGFPIVGGLAACKAVSMEEHVLFEKCPEGQATIECASSSEAKAKADEGQDVYDAYIKTCVEAKGYSQSSCDKALDWSKKLPTPVDHGECILQVGDIAEDCAKSPMDCINAQYPWAAGWEDMKEGVGKAWDETEKGWKEFEKAAMDKIDDFKDAMKDASLSIKDIEDSLEEGWSGFTSTAKIYDPMNAITSINNAVKGEAKKAIENLADSKVVEDFVEAFDPDNYDKHGKKILSGLNKVGKGIKKIFR